MACEGFCVFPHGRLSIYTLILGLSAYMFTISGSFGCWFIKIDGHLLDVFPYHIQLDTSGVSPLSYEQLNQERFTCVAFPENMVNNFLDGMWHTSRICAIVANVLIGVSMLLLISTTCMEHSQGTLMVVGVMMIGGSIAEMLMFFLFGSKIIDAPFNGSFHVGAAVSICGALVAAACGVLMFFLPPASEVYLGTEPTVSNAGVPAFAPGTETITETVMPDGSKKITKTITNLDGTQQVEENIVNPATAA